MAKIDEILLQDKTNAEILYDLYEHEKTVSDWLDENQNKKDCKYTKDELYKKYTRITNSIVEFERKLKGSDE